MYLFFISMVNILYIYYILYFYINLHGLWHYVGYSNDDHVRVYFFVFISFNHLVRLSIMYDDFVLIFDDFNLNPSSLVLFSYCLSFSFFYRL